MLGPIWRSYRKKEGQSLRAKTNEVVTTSESHFGRDIGRIFAMGLQNERDLGQVLT